MKQRIFDIEFVENKDDCMYEAWLDFPIKANGVSRLMQWSLIVRHNGRGDVWLYAYNDAPLVHLQDSRAQTVEATEKLARSLLCKYKDFLNLC